MLKVSKKNSLNIVHWKVFLGAIIETYRSDSMQN